MWEMLVLDDHMVLCEIVRLGQNNVDGSDSRCSCPHKNLQSLLTNRAQICAIQGSGRLDVCQKGENNRNGVLYRFDVNKMGITMKTISTSQPKPPVET